MVPPCSRSQADHCPTEHGLRRPWWKTKSMSEHRLPSHDYQGPRTCRVGIVTQLANVASTKGLKRALGQSENAAKRSRARVGASQSRPLVKKHVRFPPLSSKNTTIRMVRDHPGLTIPSEHSDLLATTTDRVVARTRSGAWPHRPESARGRKPVPSGVRTAPGTESRTTTKRHR